MSEDPRWARVQMWRPVREAMQAADQLFDEAERLRDASEVESAGSQVPQPPPAGYLRKRSALRDLLEARVDPALAEQLGLWQKHLAMTAIAAYIDERERVALGPLAAAWRLPLVQTELLEIDDGGDRFFSQLHELLGRADVHALVLEIYLYCLRAGFVGRFRDRRHDLERLTARVVARVRADQPRRLPAAVPLPAAGPRRRVGFVGFPLRYYLGALGAALALFVGLRLASNSEVAGSNVAGVCRGKVVERAGGAP